MVTSFHPDRRLLIAVDMERYSRQDNVAQYRSQLTFQQAMRQTTDELGLDRANWMTQQGGDGELAILPQGTSEVTIVASFAPTLDRILRTHNHSLVSTSRVRLRMAVHEGLVHLDGANGYPGEAIVTVCRLVDAPPLKRALRSYPGANVALIVSERVYHDVVRHYPDLRPERFRHVPVRLADKDFDADAWIFIPDEDLSDFDGGEPITGPTTGTAPSVRSSQAATAPPPAASGSQFTFGGSVRTTGTTVFGDHNTVTGRGGSDERHQGR